MTNQDLAPHFQRISPSGEGWRRRRDERLYALAIGAFGTALGAADPTTLVSRAAKVRNGILKVGGLSLRLSDYSRVFVIGGGKASGAMALALEKLLGRWITAGVVNVPDYQRTIACKRIRLHPASHPVPNSNGVSGVREMLKLAPSPRQDDLFICLISGGGSSLLPAPAPGVTLEDERKITEELLLSGASIDELNAVRKHISSIKGGRLAERLHPATVLSLVISDVVGDRLDTIASGPTAPDSTTFADVRAILSQHHLWLKAPKRIRELIRLGEAGGVPDTPKKGSKVFRNVHNLIIGNNRMARKAAVRFLTRHGFRTVEIPKELTGEAKRVATTFAGKLLDANAKGSDRPIAIVAGGETTVTVRGGGVGGRNQEFALSASMVLNGHEGVLVASLATDGVDGPTSGAGALADGSTVARGRELGMVAHEYLRRNDSHTFFKALGDLIVTGPTGTNVNDVFLALSIPGKR